MRFADNAAGEQRHIPGALTGTGRRKDGREASRPRPELCSAPASAGGHAAADGPRGVLTQDRDARSVRTPGRRDSSAPARL